MKKPRIPESGHASPLPNRRRLVRYLFVLVGCLLVVDSLVGDRGLIAMRKAREEYHALEVDLERAKAENARLREEARRLREDPQAIEDVARRELGLIKPGEKLFIVKDVPPPQAKK